LNAGGDQPNRAREVVPTIQPLSRKLEEKEEKKEDEEKEEEEEVYWARNLRRIKKSFETFAKRMKGRR
jgi:hypothetical protein